MFLWHRAQAIPTARRRGPVRNLLIMTSPISSGRKEQSPRRLQAAPGSGRSWHVVLGGPAWA